MIQAIGLRHRHFVYAVVSYRGSFFFFKQKTAYEMRISDWSSDVCSSDLLSLRTAPFPESVRRRALARRRALLENPLRVLWACRRIAGGVAAAMPGDHRSPGGVTLIIRRRRSWPSRSGRSEERRVGKEFVSTSISRCSPYH